jgi:hypothetical protein
MGGGEPKVALKSSVGVSGDPYDEHAARRVPNRFPPGLLLQTAQLGPAVST